MTETNTTVDHGEPSIELDLGENPKSITVSLGDTQTTQTEDSRPTVVHEPRTKPDGEQNELGQYSEKVQKRIDRLTAKLRETERREQAALEYARNVQGQAQQFEQRLHQTDTGRLSEAKTRAETQAMTLKQIIRKAREEGDIDTETEALERLTGLQMEQRQIAEQAYHRANYQPQIQTPPPAVAPQQQKQTDPRAEEWAEQNEWFGKNTVMTHTAWGIHRQLIESEGFDTQTDEYYDELNRRIRDAFPKEFQNSREEQTEQPRTPRAQRPVQAVAPANRSSGVNNARRSVRLSPSQVAIARKLNVPLEEYAKYVKD